MADGPNLRVIPGGAEDGPRIHAWVELEQQVLGALLLHPERIPDVAGRGGRDLFHDPVHKELYARMAERERDGLLVSPVALAHIPAVVDLVKDIGGPAYLVRLAGASISAFALSAYVDQLAENHQKRALAAALDAARADLDAGLLSASDVAAKVEMAALAVTSTRTSVRPVSLMAAATDAVAAANDAYQGAALPVTPSGIPELDRIISGFGPAELILLGGRPGMGKTGIALSIALRAAEAGHPVVFVSLEMTPQAIALRALAADNAGRGNHAVAYSDIRRGEMTEEQFRGVVAAAHRISELPFAFLPRGFGEPAALYMGARQAVARMGLSSMPLVIVDYLQLMRVPGASRFEKITEISIGLKETAMRLECPVLALSQLSREVEKRDDKRPQLADLRESGQLEQDADTILFAYRPEYYLAREEPDLGDIEDHAAWRASMEQVRNRAEIIVAKQRQGETGVARIRFNPALNLVWGG